MRPVKESLAEFLSFSLVTVAVYFALQTIVAVMHEYAHSGAAWLLGYAPTPFSVVWGNPLTLEGWDEGVPYDRLFPSVGHPAEAAIGGIPMLMHAAFVGLGLYFLRTLSNQRKRVLYVLYLFVVVNLTELVAYILMRPFAGSGDTGRFNEGFGLSPWPLFVAGTVLLSVALWVLLFNVTPRLGYVMSWSSRKHWMVLCFTAFVMFLWGSGLRIMALYPDRQWKWGLIGLVGFLAWISLSPRYLLDR
jgi:hypothetical protein